MSVRRALLAAGLVLSTSAIAQGVDYSEVALPDAKKEAQAVELMDSIRCVVCQGQPISGSNADLAGDMRRMIRERIASGEDPEKVRAYLISRYGDFVSFKPPVSGKTSPLWLVPFLALLGGVWLVTRRLKRRAR